MLRQSAPSTQQPMRANTGPPTGNWLALIRAAVKLAAPAVRAMLEKRKGQR